MPRSPRIEIPGGAYHVGGRGNRGCRIFADAYEGRIFLKLLERVSRRYSWTCYAYCLMSNHYHLVLRLEDGGLSDGIRELNGGFARFTNVRHGLEGHLFRNRFWSELIEDDAYLLQASRYIVLNPVRAHLCTTPEQWRWSSHRSYIGLDYAPGFLAVNDFLRLFAPSARSARNLYCKFVEDGIDDGAPGVRHRRETRTPHER